jgi:hypothetical protein
MAKAKKTAGNSRTKFIEPYANKLKRRASNLAVGLATRATDNWSGKYFGHG